jgi:AcrR family transcriptional regulator
MRANGKAPEVEPASAGLQSGERGIGREKVSEIQRARMLSAMVGEVSRRGAGNVSVAHVVARSGVSRRTFYEVFDDREDCFLAAFDEGIERLAHAVVPAYERARGWRERIRAGLVAGLGALDGDPGLARLLLVETLGAGPRALERRSRVLEALIAAVDDGREEAKAGREATPLAGEGVVGAVLAVLHGRLLANDHGSLVSLTNQLMGIVVLPYLGAAAARRELDRPVPTASKVPVTVECDPLRELEMRLTYRTVRVLMAVAADPGSSNRAVADGAGIADQGQISKLLARLHGLGLIDNNGAGPKSGVPNEWTLTTKGWEVHAAVTRDVSAP